MTEAKPLTPEKQIQKLREVLKLIKPYLAANWSGQSYLLSRVEDVLKETVHKP